MQIEPWHVPLLAMIVVVLPLGIVELVRWRLVRPRRREDTSPKSRTREAWRTRILAVTTLALLVLLYLAIGQTVTDVIAAGATFVTTMVTAALTVQSFITLQDIKKLTADDAGGGAPRAGDAEPE